MVSFAKKHPEVISQLMGDLIQFTFKGEEFSILLELY